MVEKKNLRIVYMGTPDFAVEALCCLVEGGYNVVGVITMPDKPAGRGHKLQFSPVKQYALEHNLPLLQPEKLKDEAFVEALRAWKADLQIVVAFRMLPEVVWNMPRLGTFNLHASLLPQYRGAAPINWAVINGDTETGITTFFLKHEIDTGEVIQQVRVPRDEQIIYNHRLETLALNTVDAGRVMQWTDGYLIFQTASFDQIVKTIERKFDVTINYETERFAGRSFTMKFNPDEGLKQVLEVMKEMIKGLNYKIKEDKVYIN